MDEVHSGEALTRVRLVAGVAVSVAGAGIFMQQKSPPFLQLLVLHLFFTAFWMLSCLYLHSYHSYILNCYGDAVSLS